MERFGKKKRFFQALSILCVLVFAGSGFAATLGGPRVIPNGKIQVFDGRIKVAELTAESPLPEGKILKVEGKCGIKLDSLYLVAADKSTLMIGTPKNGRQLALQDGRVYFGITALPQPITVITPRGAVVIQEVVLKASVDSTLLKGYVSVSGQTAEIGVIEGGAMILSTADGERKIKSGQRFLLAQATLPGQNKENCNKLCEEKYPPGDKQDKCKEKCNCYKLCEEKYPPGDKRDECKKKCRVAAGALLGSGAVLAGSAGIIGGMLFFGNNGGDDNNTASPKQP